MKKEKDEELLHGLSNSLSTMFFLSDMLKDDLSEKGLDSQVTALEKMQAELNKMRLKIENYRGERPLV